MTTVTYLRPATSALVRDLHLSNDLEKRRAINAALDDMARGAVVLREEGGDKAELLDIVGFLLTIAGNLAGQMRDDLDAQGLYTGQTLDTAPLEAAFARIEKPATASEYIAQRKARAQENLS